VNVPESAARVSALPMPVRYLVTALAVALAVAIEFALAPLIKGSTAPILLAAVTAATWFGGLGHGLAATGLTGVGQLAYILAHEPGGGLADSSVILRVVLYVVLAGAVTGVLTEVRRVAGVAARGAEERETALRASEARFRGLLDAAPDAIVIVDCGGRIVLANRQVEALFGYTATELVGQLVEVLMPEGFRGGHVAQRERYVSNPRARPMGVGVDLAARRKDGSVFPVEISLSPMETEEGLLVSASVRDITERKRTESRVRALNADLQRRVTELGAVNRELEAFSYSVSHDLRTPLRSIDGFSQAILEEYDDRLDGQGRDYLRRVRAAATRMGELIDDLLMLSRVTRREMRREPVDLGALARTVAAHLERAQLYPPVEFSVGDGLAVAGDPHLLRIVLENLLGNAWKFSSKVAQPRVEFGATTTRAGERAFFVRDNGVGFDLAHAEKLFGAFQRLHAMHEFPGTGIGLATVQRIVTRHGGRVWAESAPDRGATFYFTIEEAHHERLGDDDPAGRRQSGRRGADDAGAPQGERR
jgi:PAS domain S-box-containing protein